MCPRGGVQAIHQQHRASFRGIGKHGITVHCKHEFLALRERRHTLFQSGSFAFSNSRSAWMFFRGGTEKNSIKGKVGASQR